MKTNSRSFWLTAITCLSFCFGGWYCTRGLQWLIEFDLSPMAHEILAFIFAGIIPSIVFEVCVNMLSLKKRVYGITSGPYNQYSRSGVDALPAEAVKALLDSEAKKFATFRYFIIASNILGFLLSFVYFYNRLPYAWGKVLFNFLLALIMYCAFLVYQSRKTEKNKWAFLIMQTSRIFFLTYGILAVVSIFF